MPPKKLHQPDPKQPEPRHAPPKKSRASEPAAPDAVDYYPTELAGLTLQHQARRLEAAVDNHSPTRDTALILAASEVDTVVDNVLSIHEAETIDWDLIAHDVGRFATRCAHLEAALKVIKITNSGIAERLAAIKKAAHASTDVARAVDDRGNAGPDQPMPAATVDQQLEMAQQALQSANVKATTLGAQLKPDDRATLNAQCAIIVAPLDLAAYATTTLDKQTRLTLTRPILAISALLDPIEQQLVMPPKAPWQPSFARMFDAENELRRAVGKPPLPRAYTGTVDPKEAIAQLDHIAKDPQHKPQDASIAGAGHAPDPATAVRNITIGMAALFGAQKRAVDHLSKDLAEPHIAPPPGIVEALVRMALTMAVGGATTLIGNAVVGAFGRYFKSKDAASQGAIDKALQDLPPEALEKTATDLAARYHPSEFARSAASGTAKSMATGFFKAATENVGKADSHVENAKTPLNKYVEGQQTVLDDIIHKSELSISNLSSALVQLDLDTLNEFSMAVNSMPASAYDLQYDTSMREWQNFKLSLHSTPRDPHDTSTHDRNIPAADHAGVLEGTVEILNMRPVRSPKLTHLTLAGGEDAAITHFQKNPRALGGFTGIHESYTIKFVGPGTGGVMIPAIVTLTINANGVLQPLDPEDVETLKAFEQGHLATTTIVNVFTPIVDPKERARLRSDVDANKAAHEIAAILPVFNTAQVESKK